MRDIVQDLLELSRLEAGSDEAPTQPVDLPSLLAEVVLRARTTESAPPIELEMDADCWLQGSERELHSIASNLLSNAVKYTPASGTITVRWSKNTQGARLSVADTGIGIAAEHLPRLTERFYRADRARARSTGGSGLGLSIVKHALQRHGGRLEIDSVEGRGSTFSAHFPARRVMRAARPGRAAG
jgi:two-component system phosphate regulon sensor histidine kinase PhoR